MPWWLLGREVIDAGRALEAVHRLQRVAQLRPVERLRLLHRGGGEHDRVPAASGPVRIAVAVLGAPRLEELADLGLQRAVRQRVVDLRRRGDEEELVAEHFGHRPEHRDVLQAGQHDHVEAELLDVLRRRQRGAAEPDLEDRARAGRIHLLDRDAQVRVVGLVLLDADDLEAEVLRLLLGRRLLRIGVGRGIVQHADLLHLRLVLQVFEPRHDFEARRRDGGERPFDVIGLLRQDRAQHHRRLGAHHDRRGGEIAGRHAAAREHVHFVRRDHLAIDRHGLLRLGAVVLDHELDLPAGDAALGVQRRDRDLDAVAPGAIDRRRIAGETGRHADLVDVLRVCARVAARSSAAHAAAICHRDLSMFLPLCFCLLCVASFSRK